MAYGVCLASTVPSCQPCLLLSDMQASLVQPQMVVVPDVSDVFVPLLDGFLVDAEESSLLIDM